MTVGDLLANEAFSAAFAGGFLGFILAVGITLAVIFIVGLYIYFSLAWYRIASKLKYKKPWLAWIPIANIAMFLQLGRFSWGLVFLILIPVVGWIALLVLVIMAKWRIFEKRKYPGFYSLSLLIPQIGFVLYLIAIGFIAWKDKNSR